MKHLKDICTYSKSLLNNYQVHVYTHVMTKNDFYGSHGFPKISSHYFGIEW